MATIIREFLTRFGIKADPQGAKRYEQAVNSLRDNLGRATKAAAKFSAGLATAASVGMGTLIHGLSESTLEVQRWSAAFGIGTDQVQQLGYAANTVGLELEDMADVLNTLGERGFDALADPKSEPAKLFARMGIALKDARGQLKPSRELLDELADGFTRIKNPTEQAALASILLGDVGVKLLPVLQGGAEGLAAYGAEAKALGVVLDGDAIEQVNAFNRASIALKTALRGVGTQIALVVLPMLTRLAEAVSGWLKGAGLVGRAMEAMRKHSLTLRRALLVLAGALAVVASAKIAAGFAALVSVVRSLMLAFRGLATTAALAKGAVMAIPLAIVALLILLEDIAVWLRGGDSLVGRFVDRWREAPGPVGDIARALDAAKPYLQDFVGVARELAQVAWDIAAAWFEAAQKVIFPIIKAVVRAFVGIARQIGPPIKRALMGAFASLQRMLPSIIKVIKALIAHVSRILSAAVRILIRVAGKLFRFGVRLWEALIPVVGKVITALGKYVETMWPIVEKVLIAIWDGVAWLIDTVSPHIETFVAYLEPLIGGPIYALLMAIEAIYDGVQDTIARVRPLIEAVVEWLVGLKNGFVAFWVGVGDWIAAIARNIAKFFGKAINAVIKMFKPLFEVIDSAVSAANALGADISFSGVGALNSLQKKVTAATNFELNTAVPQVAGVNAPISVGGVEVNVNNNGATPLKPEDVRRAVAGGVGDGGAALREAMRDNLPGVAARALTSF